MSSNISTLGSRSCHVASLMERSDVRLDFPEYSAAVRRRDSTLLVSDPRDVNAAHENDGVKLITQLCQDPEIYDGDVDGTVSVSSTRWTAPLGCVQHKLPQTPSGDAQLFHLFITFSTGLTALCVCGGMERDLTRFSSVAAV